MKRWVAAAACAVGLLASAHASADAVVNVSVRNAAGQAVDGVVQLRPTGPGKSFSCSTSRGGCTMRSVPGGSYVVTFRPRKGTAPAPRKVMIPPTGKADLHISAK